MTATPSLDATEAVGAAGATAQTERDAVARAAGYAAAKEDAAMVLEAKCSDLDKWDAYTLAMTTGADEIRRLTDTKAEGHATEQPSAAQTERDEVIALLLRLANAADAVGVKFFDTDTMEPEVEEMQAATQSARAALKGRGT